eukprot:TRINITY_DN33673_c0_g1_i1.p1 TRINITY_DN33673_c0_g1~~TRINITY_DN33673_c0_g1_i1.p1  ORF type:complete len:398 (+),score=45.89 TRINITY_DN33673_c0_g1_i1:35-1228(+)
MSDVRPEHAAVLTSTTLEFIDTRIPSPASSSKWVIGVALVITGLFAGTSGMQLIRTSELRRRAEHFVESHIFFALGMLLNVIIGPLFDVAGYAFAPASVIAPMTGLNIVLNMIFAPLTLGEELTSLRRNSAFIVFLTATLSVFFKQSHTEEWTLEYTHEILCRRRVVLYMACFLVWFIFNVGYLQWHPTSPVVRGFSLGATAGSLAGNMWCTRIAAVFGAECISGHCEVWTHWISWAVLAGAIFFAVSNLPFMAKGMQKYEALFMVTIFQGSNIVSNSLSATLVLSEMDGEPWWRIMGYSCCILGMMSGLVVLARGEGASSDSTTMVRGATPSREASSANRPAELSIALSQEANEECSSGTERTERPFVRGFVKALCKDPIGALSPKKPLQACIFFR